MLLVVVFLFFQVLLSRNALCMQILPVLFRIYARLESIFSHNIFY